MGGGLWLCDRSIGSIDVANINFPSSPTLGQQYTFNGVTYTFTAQGVWSPGSSISILAAAQGRLTLQSSTPVMVSSSTGSTAIFYTPYVGDRIPIIGANGPVMTQFAELAGSTTDATKNPSPLNATKLNDWFVWNDAGTVRLCHGPDWSDNTTRSAGTALARVNGILVNATSITNGPAAQRGTYVGTTYTNGSAQLDFKLGAAGLGGTAALLNIWNNYNRVSVWTQVSDTTSSWTIPGDSVYRPLNASNNNRVSFVSGLKEDAVNASIWQPTGPLASGTLIGMGMDTAAIFTGPTGWSNVVGGYMSMGANNIYPPPQGFHFVQAIQWSGGATTCYGDGATLSGVLLSQGLQFMARM
jgi:hypothetical protein